MYTAPPVELSAEPSGEELFEGIVIGGGLSFTTPRDPLLEFDSQTKSG